MVSGTIWTVAKAARISISSCLTVAEYQALNPGARWRYRTVRHPLVANILLPPLVFILLYRLPFDMPKSWRRERRMVHLTTLAIVAILGGLGLPLGYECVAAVQLPVLVSRGDHRRLAVLGAAP